MKKLDQCINLLVLVYHDMSGHPDFVDGELYCKIGRLLAKHFAVPFHEPKVMNKSLIDSPENQ